MAKRRMPKIVMEQIELIHEVFGRAISDPDVYPRWFAYCYTLARGLERPWPLALEVDRSFARVLDELMSYRLDGVAVAEAVLLNIVREKHPVLAQAFGRNLDMLLLGAACIWLEIQDGWPDWPRGQVRLLSGVTRVNPVRLHRNGGLFGDKEARTEDYVQASYVQDWLTRRVVHRGRTPSHSMGPFESCEDFITRTVTAMKGLRYKGHPVTQPEVLEALALRDHPRRIREWCKTCGITWAELKTLSFS
jgi:hypothetical protein